MMPAMSNPVVPIAFLKHPVHFLALGFGSGLSPKAPGTAGTVVAVLLYLPLQLLSPYLFLALTLLVCAAGILICTITSRALQVHDHPAIVWDEIAGFFVTMLYAPAGWLWILTGFVLFRLFDIFKPWPISVADKQVRGGLGIMLDDILAGIASLVCLQLIHYLL